MQSKFIKDPQRKSQRLKEPNSTIIRPVPTNGLAAPKIGQITTSTIKRNSNKDHQKVESIVITLFKEYGSTIQFNDIFLGAQI